MVKDFKYIIKRILIGVGIALILMLFKGGLIADVHAADQNYNITIYNGNSGCGNLNVNTSTFTNINYTGSCKGGITQIRIKSRYNILQRGSNYDLYTTIVLGKSNQTLGLRSDFYTGNYQASTWNGQSTITWNNLDNVSTGTNGYYNLTWGLVQQFTSATDSNGFTFDFYFTDPVDLNYLRIDRFELVNTGGQTQDAINNQTNTIINNNNQNTNNIINNQNENTEKEIESQKVCSVIDKNNVVLNNKRLNPSGAEVSLNGYGITNYIKVDSNSKLVLLDKASSSQPFCFYNINKSYVSCSYANMNINDEITIPSNAAYFRASINTSSNLPTFSLCKNGNQALNDTLGDLDRNITDETGLSDDEIRAYIDLDYASDTPISDLILMPLTLINKFVDGFNGSCSNYNLGNLLGTDLTLPCINVEDHVGSNIWSIIDGLCSIFLIYNIGLLFVHMYDSLTNLDDTFQELYTPKHADIGYVPKHGGGN